MSLALYLSRVRSNEVLGVIGRPLRAGVPLASMGLWTFFDALPSPPAGRRAGSS
jgi:hypothetical protein